MPLRRWCCSILLLVACAGAQAPAHAPSGEVAGNDNTDPAGTLEGGVLSLDLEIGRADWRWERALPPYRVLAFAEAGHPLTTPGPLIRVPEETLVVVTIQSRVDVDIEVHGLDDRLGRDDPLLVPARGRVRVRFRAGQPGTFYYWGAVRGGRFAEREGDDSQLHGALVVDPPGGSPPDRVFVIGYHASRPRPKLDAWVINGRSWPETERLAVRVGQPVRWRFINATGHRHPMHLHGHFFRVDRLGDGRHDVTGTGHDEVATQVMQPGSTMAMSWTPARPGNWLFHCHILFHVIPDNRLQLPRWFEEYAELPHDHHMSGLVLGIHARGPRVAERGGSPRRLALVVGERPGVRYQVPGLAGPGLGYGLDGGPITAPGPALVLERGRPVEVTITNRIAHATTVHWHGIELDSYYDGVPHWGTDGRNLTPTIAPGGAFVARFTPPRAGTFIYHTHFNDYAQLATGLYGALIVLEKGATVDPEVDHTFVISRDGLDEDKAPVLLNGSVEPPAIRLRAGLRHRLRLIGITPVASVRVRLLRRGQPITWRQVAKDGRALAAPRSRVADLTISPGETYDFEIAPEEPDELVLEVALDRQEGQRASVRFAIEG